MIIYIVSLIALIFLMRHYNSRLDEEYGSYPAAVIQAAVVVFVPIIMALLF